jgi:hypothetical protein
MAASMYAYKCDFIGIYLLQSLTVFNRYQPIFGPMNNVGVTIYKPNPFIGAQVITQHPIARQQG